MPTQRPFFSNFLTIFRAHSISKAQPSISTSGVAAAGSAQTIWTSAVSAQKQTKQSSEPLPINAKSNAYSTAAAAVQDQKLHASLTPLQHNVSPQTHLPRSPSSQGLPVYGPPNKPQPNYPTASESRRTRRGSDSSASSGGGGFREARSGGETWFVGGRTATGEEKFYKLSMVKRDRSSDRISADQLSL